MVTLSLPFRIALQVEPNGSTWLGDRTDAELFGVGDGGGERLLAAGDLRTALQSRTYSYDPEVSIEFRCTPKALAEYEQSRSGLVD